MGNNKLNADLTRGKRHKKLNQISFLKGPGLIKFENRYHKSNYNSAGEGNIVSYTFSSSDFSIAEEPQETYVTLNWENHHILVVEDDITCLELINEFLEETGIKISNGTTGLEAVKICRKDASIDIVLMDMRMPEMDGYEATKRIKEFRPDLPIVAQTAHALSDDKKKCLSAGCDDYLTKPIIQNILFGTISKFLDKKK
jgi:two-component system, cell cycle response regulator DivK